MDNIYFGINRRGVQAFCSQEVIGSSSVDVAKLVLLGCWVELQEGVLHELVNLHNGGFVTTSVTVVWC